MKILILTFNLGVTASGIITNRLVNELYNKGHEIVVLTGFSDDEERKFKVTKCSPFPLKPARLYTFIGNMIQRDLNLIFWELRAYYNAKKIMKLFHPDIIYARSSPGCSFNVGLRLSRKYNIPLALHFVDPLPATPDWHPNTKYRRKITKTYLPAIVHATSISFGNEAMLIYQQETTNMYLRNKSFILPNPIPERRIFNPPSSHAVVFTFLGTFIGSRSPESLLAAFSRVLKKEPSCELRIYGTSYKLMSNYLNQYGEIGDKIKILDRTSDIYKVFEESTILVDVDANVPRQVFTSNKVMEYLSVNRYILSITPDNSPTSNLLKELKNTCFVTNHCVNNVESAMIKAINTEWSDALFNERASIRINVGIKNLTALLEKKLLEVINS